MYARTHTRAHTSTRTRKLHARRLADGALRRAGRSRYTRVDRRLLMRRCLLHLLLLQLLLLLLRRNLLLRLLLLLRRLWLRLVRRRVLLRLLLLLLSERDATASGAHDVGCTCGCLRARMHLRRCGRRCLLLLRRGSRRRVSCAADAVGRRHDREKRSLLCTHRSETHAPLLFCGGAACAPDDGTAELFAAMAA
jgi:hypothetical protein